MRFLVGPPEVNSALMLAGASSEPLLAVAADADPPGSLFRSKSGLVEEN